MSLEALNVGDRIRFTFPDDKENPTIFWFNVLDERAYYSLSSKFAGFADSNGKRKESLTGEDVKKLLDASYDVVRFGLANWENFSHNGIPIRFLTDTIADAFGDGRPRLAVSADTMQKIRVRGRQFFISELASAILSAQEIKESELKNSDSQSSST